MKDQVWDPNLMRFNSKLVRLEVNNTNLIQRVFEVGFNSKLVRLEDEDNRHIYGCICFNTNWFEKVSIPNWFD